MDMRNNSVFIITRLLFCREGRRPRRPPRLSKSLMGLIVFLFSSLFSFAVTNTPLALRYARIYERELAGDEAELVQDYQALFSDARELDKDLAEKSLYRIGMCEKKAGRLELARKAWRSLVEAFPLNDPVVSNARDSLKALEWELDRIVISGKVGGEQGAGGSGQGGGRCVVFAGEWGSEPPVLTETNGCFRVGRRAAGQLPDGRSYALIYAEHATLDLVGADVWMSSMATGLTISLAKPVSLAGTVVDQAGRPVPAVRIRVTGFKAAPENSSVSGAPSYTVPFPVDRLIPPVFCDAKGVFWVEGLPAGLRYEVKSDIPENHVVLEMEGAALSAPHALSNLVSGITWLRGDSEMDNFLRWGDFEKRGVVFHFGSAYEESSLRSQYPNEGGGLSRLMELYGSRDLICLWVLPEGEGRGEAAQLALGLYPDLPVGVAPGEERAPQKTESESGFRSSKSEVRSPERGKGGWGELRGNVVMGRDGRVLSVCSDQQVFKAVKKAMGE